MDLKRTSASKRIETHPPSPAPPPPRGTHSCPTCRPTRRSSEFGCRASASLNWSLGSLGSPPLMSSSLEVDENKCENALSVVEVWARVGLLLLLVADRRQRGWAVGGWRRRRQTVRRRPARGRRRPAPTWAGRGRPKQMSTGRRRPAPTWAGRGRAGADAARPWAAGGARPAQTSAGSRRPAQRECCQEQRVSSIPPIFPSRPFES